MIPRRDAVLNAQVYQLGWMTTTFVPIRRWSGAWERSLSQGFDERPWFGVPTSRSGWTSVVPPCHQTPIGGSVCFL